MPGTAAAQKAAGTATVAQTMFEAGRKLLKDGKVHEACEKFAESEKLDPALGTLLNLANCHALEGRTATAWAEYKDAVTQAAREKQSKRERLAEARVRELEANLSTLTVQVPQAAQLPGLVVLVNGVSLGQAAWGTEVPVDPGEQSIEVTAPGHEPWHSTVQVGPSKDKRQVEIPVLTPLPVEPPVPSSSTPSPAAPPPAPSASHSAVPAPAPALPPPSSHNTLAYVAGGVGLVALGVGTYFGVQAFSRWDDRNSHCDPVCDNQAVAAKNDASRAANIANVGFGVGVVGIGAAAILLLTSSPSAPSSGTGIRVDPWAGPRTAGVAAGGAW